MHRVAARSQRRHHDGIAVEITFRSGSSPDADRAIGELGRHGPAIGLGHRHHGLDTQCMAGTDDAHRNFAAVGDQHPAQRTSAQVKHQASGLMWIST